MTFRLGEIQGSSLLSPPKFFEKLLELLKKLKLETFYFEYILG